MRRNRRRDCALAGAALLCFSGWSFADHFSSTWSFAGPGGWTNGVNWSTNPNAPINGTHTYDATIALSSAEVSLVTNVSVVDFTMSDGRFTGGGTLNVIGAALINGGTIVGSGAININDTLVLDGGEKVIGQRTINVLSGGSVIWSSGLINASDDVGGGGIVNNAGIWQDDSNDAYIWNSVQSPVFNNTGTLIKIGGVHTKVYDPVFNNSGFVDIQQNGLYFTGGGLNTGSYSVAVDSTLAFSDYMQFYAAAGSSTTVFSSTAVISSQGTVAFLHQFGSSTTAFGGQIDSPVIVVDTDDDFEEPQDEGRVTFLAGALVNTINPPAAALFMRSGTARFETGQGSIFFGSATLDGGIIHTTDPLFFNTITWNAGMIMGDEVLAESGIGVSTGSLEMLGTGPKTLQDVTFYNGIDSVATISEGSLSLVRAEFINLANAIVDIQGPAIISNDGVNNDGTAFVISPDALLVKSAGAGSAEFRDLMVHNNGEVVVDVGTLRLNGGGYHTGYFFISANATLELGMGAHLNGHVFDFPSSLSADFGSTLRIVGDTQFLNGTSIQIETMEVDGASVTIEGGAMMTGALNLSNGANVYIAPDFNKTIKVKSISFVPFSESGFDLTNNKLIVDYDPEPEADVADQIRQYIAAGHNTGTWDGEMLITSLGDATEFALGYGDNSVLGFDDFGDFAVDEHSVLIKYTYYGDANLDGQVDARDLYMLALGWLGSGLWTDGDFNYDGFVDQQDLTLMAKNWQSGNNAPLGTALEGLGLPPVSIPEPSGFTVLLLLPLLTTLKSRRHRHFPASIS